MENLWILLLLIVIIRSIWRMMERAGQAGRSGEPWEYPGGGRGGATRPVPKDKEEEYRTPLNIPEYLKRRSDGTSGTSETPGEADAHLPSRVATTSSSRDAVEGRAPEQIMREYAPSAAYVDNTPGDAKADESRGIQEQQQRENPLEGILNPSELMRGIIWSQVLGTRGGRRAQRR